MTMKKMLKMEVDVQVVQDFYVQLEKKKEKFILLVQDSYVENGKVVNPWGRSRESS